MEIESLAYFHKSIIVAIVLHVHPPPGKEERGCSALVGVGGQEAKNTDSNKMPLGNPA